MLSLIVTVLEDNRAIGSSSYKINLDTLMTDTNNMYLDMIDRLTSLKEMRNNHYGHNVDVTNLRESDGKAFCSDCDEWFFLDENFTDKLRFLDKTYPGYPPEIEEYDIAGDR